MQVNVDIHNVSLLFKPSSGDFESKKFDVLLSIKFDVEGEVTILREATSINIKDVELIYNIMTNDGSMIINNKCDDPRIAKFQKIKMRFLIGIKPKNNYNKLKNFINAKKEYVDMIEEYNKGY